ncbi:MFS transporter [Acaryochloris sp. 'Moss Beach']|uniref:MFS transporter n=1 Tax=Acaryochloris sp. 'Moss Beach' TaxID=2740837 RepID=UPI001F2232C5|nr:MFS transporter [Acaryochloris sp. 'Moss Beach']UJB71530.1 MFS transporter [Acaryochloris sp. 'Moss Beach']
MKFFSWQGWTRWIPVLDPQVWILAAGRLLSQMGTGFTLYFLQIFFVNKVGLTATSVGFAIGSASISGIVGRVLSGSMTDSRWWGRRRTLLLSLLIAAIAAGIIAIAQSFWMLVLGNIVMGFGVGLYWPATEAIIADLSAGEQRQEAFTITRFADSAGLGLGVILGGGWIAFTQAYRALFIIDAVSFVMFFGVVYFTISETSNPHTRGRHGWQGWMIASKDRRLRTYIVANIVITTYLAQIYSTMPLYFKNFAQQGVGLSEVVITGLFSWHLGASVASQLPVARFLRRWPYPQGLMTSVGCWGLGFLLIGMTGLASQGALIWAILGLGVLAIATVAYMPIASSLVADLAPIEFRGVYLSINSLCWAVGYFIGPALGGLALDRQQPFTDLYWGLLALSIGLALMVLKHLDDLLGISSTNALTSDHSH